MKFDPGDGIGRERDDTPSSSSELSAFFGWKYLKEGITKTVMCRHPSPDGNKPKFVRTRKRFRTVTWRYQKSIGAFGSFVFLVNQILGSGLVNLPSVVRASGWLPCLLCNGFLCAMAATCTLMLIRAITMIPGNQNFEQRFEYSSVLKYYLSTKMAFALQMIYHIGVQCGNIVSIVAVAQAFDQTLVASTGYTMAFLVYPSAYFSSSKRDVFCCNELSSLSNQCLSESLCSPQLNSPSTTSSLFTLLDSEKLSSIYSGSEVTLCITLGYALAAILLIRLSAMNLEENMKVQFVTFCSIMVIILYLCGVCLTRIGFLPNNIEPSNDSIKHSGVGSFTEFPRLFGVANFAPLLTTFLDGYQYIINTPAWANEITDDVPVANIVWISTLFASFVCYVFGVSLATAFPVVAESGANVLHQLLIYSSSTEQCAIEPSTSYLSMLIGNNWCTLGYVTTLVLYAFIFFTILPSIVTTNISAKYNLINTGVASNRVAFLLACVGPFCVSWIVSNESIGDLLGYFSFWSGLACNYIAPAAIYVIACRLNKYSVANPLHEDFEKNKSTIKKLQSKTSHEMKLVQNDTKKVTQKFRPKLVADVEGITAGGGGGTQYNAKVREVQLALQDWLSDFARNNNDDEDVTQLANWQPEERRIQRKPTFRLKKSPKNSSSFIKDAGSRSSVETSREDLGDGFKKQLVDALCKQYTMTSQDSQDKVLMTSLKEEKSPIKLSDQNVEPSILIPISEEEPWKYDAKNVVSFHEGDVNSPSSLNVDQSFARSGRKPKTIMKKKNNQEDSEKYCKKPVESLQSIGKEVTIQPTTVEDELPSSSSVIDTILLASPSHSTDFDLTPKMEVGHSSKSLQYNANCTDETTEGEPSSLSDEITKVRWTDQLRSAIVLFIVLPILFIPTLIPGMSPIIPVDSLRNLIHKDSRAQKLLDTITRKIEGGEDYGDAFVVDEDIQTGALKTIRVHVFPPGYLRRNHLTVTYIMLITFVLMSFTSFLSDSLILGTQASSLASL